MDHNKKDLARSTIVVGPIDEIQPAEVESATLTNRVEKGLAGDLAGNLLQRLHDEAADNITLSRDVVRLGTGGQALQRGLGLGNDGD